MLKSPALSRRVTVSVSIKAETVDAAQRLATDQHKSLSAFVREAVEVAITRATKGKR